MNLVNKLVAALGLCLALGSAQAATVLCPGTLGSGLNRYIEVTGALAGGECYYKEGNFQGDNVSAYLGADYALIDKDIAADDGGADGSEGYLFYTTTGTGRTSGSWTMGTDLWSTYAEVFLAFHFGNGGGSPDSFIVELQPDAMAGGWALIAGPGGRLNGLSNIYLFGRGEGGGGGDDEVVPEPASLALVGVALLAAGVARRRRRA